MLKALYGLARPALFALDPEDAHEATLRCLELGLYPRPATPDPAELGTDLWGLHFPNPLGIAAGFDKDARVPNAVLGMGCGFAEVGTTTPLPQSGNPRPRVFRLKQDLGVVNRLGFNNDGHAAALRRLRNQPVSGLLFVNIGANKDSPDRVADYVKGLETFYDLASAFTVNISSPNTPGLRDLQAPEVLARLLERLMAARSRLVGSGRPRRPIIVKIAPDLHPDDLAPLCRQLAAHDVDGVAISNTTLSRRGLLDPQRREEGGLSGRPLFHRATVMLARVYVITEGKVPLIGIGGIDSGEAAVAKIEAGASLIQLYTGLIYEGPDLIGQIKAQLAAACRNARGPLANLRGRTAEAWAQKPLE